MHKVLGGKITFSFSISPKDKKCFHCYPLCPDICPKACHESNINVLEGHHFAQGLFRNKLMLFVILVFGPDAIFRFSFFYISSHNSLFMLCSRVTIFLYVICSYFAIRHPKKLIAYIMCGHIPTIPDSLSSKWMEYDDRTATTVRRILQNRLHYRT